MSAIASHYTAVVEVTLTTHTPAQPGRYASDPGTPEKRDVAEVARHVIRAGTLAELVRKVNAHASLLVPEPVNSTAPTREDSAS